MHARARMSRVELAMPLSTQEPQNAEATAGAAADPAGQDSTAAM